VKISKIFNRVFLKIVFFEIDHYNSEGLIYEEPLKVENSNLAQKCKILLMGLMWGSREPRLEFRDYLIFRQPLKIEISIFAQIRRAVSTNKKCKISSKGVMWVSRDAPHV